MEKNERFIPRPGMWAEIGGHCGVIESSATAQYCTEVRLKSSIASIVVIDGVVRQILLQQLGDSSSRADAYPSLTIGWGPDILHTFEVGR